MNDNRRDQSLDGATKHAAGGGSPLSPDAISSCLRTSYLGRTIVFSTVTGSTNDDALRLGQLRMQGDESFQYPSGTLVLCETQTGGKGRLGRQWVSPAGGIFMSLILRPDIPVSRIPLLALVTGFSVASAIRSATGLDAKMKWPNDVLVDGRKICGILCEARFDTECPSALIVAGIGINANQTEDDFPDTIKQLASSIRILTGKTVNRNALIAEVLNAMEDTLEEFLENGLRHLRGRLNEISAYLDKPVVLTNRAEGDSSRVTGVFRGIDEDGQALIEIPGEGVLPFPAGDLSLRLV